jgi:hypothetical protein
MTDLLMEFLSKPLVIGLMIGLALALALWLRGSTKLARNEAQADEKARNLQVEIERLKQHLHTQMEITAKGNEGIRSELHERTKEVENLKATLNALQSKPGRAELRALHLFEKAVRIMNARAPGFAPVWEGAISEAEVQVKKEESGLLSWIRRPFHMNKARLGVMKPAESLEDEELQRD